MASHDREIASPILSVTLAPDWVIADDIAGDK